MWQESSSLSNKLTSEENLWAIFTDKTAVEFFFALAGKQETFANARDLYPVRTPLGGL